MITEEKIKSSADFLTYAKGYNVYQDGKVFLFDVFPARGLDYINAQVEGSCRNIYDVGMEYHFDGDKIKNAYCDCQAFQKYPGLCKHCLAVLFKYKDYSDNGYVDMFDGQPVPANGNIKPREEVQHTSPELSVLLQKQAFVKSLPIIQKSTYGQVHLTPYFSLESGKLYVEFKIGTSKMYVLKDVYSFISAVNDQVDVTYGKNLQFIHSEEAFDDESKKIVKFLQKWTDDNKEYHRQFYGYYGTAMEKVRYIDLKDEEIADFFAALGDQKIYGHVPGSANNIWTVTYERLPREITITGNDQGIELKIKKFTGMSQSKQCHIYFYNNQIYVERVSQVAQLKSFIDAMNRVRGESAYIENKDVPAFCRELLPTIQEFYKCKIENFNPEDYGMLVPEFLIYLDAPQDDMITIKPEVRYGDQKYSIYVTDNIAIRDVSAEMVLSNLISQYSNAFDSAKKYAVAAEDEELIYDLMVNGIPAMQELGEVFVSDALKRMEVRSAPKVTIGISLEGNLLDLTMTAGDMTRDELIDILSRYNKKKKFYRLKDGSFVNAVGSGMDTIAELKTSLQLTDKQLQQNQIEVPKYRALYLDSQLKDAQAVSVSKNKSFLSLVRNMKTIEDNDFEIPPELENILREYQKRGFLWIKALNYNGFGGILADDMGLGKTLQVIAFLLSEQREKKTTSADINALIVAPASLVYNWHSEIERFAPDLSTVMVTGNAEERKEILKNAGSDDILITSYDLLKRDIKEYEDHKFNYQIIDEAQYIKNAGTQVAKSVKEIQASFKLALTGTPVENRLSELWSIFDYLMPGFLYNYEKFRKEVETPVVQNGDEAAMKRLQKMIRPFVLRRLKKDVLTDLPDKLEENMYVQMTGEQQKLYDAHVKRMMLLLDKQTEEEFKTSKITILAELTKLRQICCDPSLVFDDYKAESAKVDMCINMIKNAVESGHKILLFSQFTTMLDNLALELEKAEISYYMLTGSVSKQKRLEMVEAFNKDDTSVFCISLKAGGIGSDIAVDAVDIALVDDEIKELPHLVALSKRMMTTIKLNMTFSMCLNFVAIILAIIGTLSPVVGALVHNAGSVLVIINSSLLLKWRR